MGGGVEFPYRGEWNDLNGDGEVTYDELGLEAVSGELTEYFIYDSDSGNCGPSADNLVTFSDYSSAYITFPSSVTSFISINTSPFSEGLPESYYEAITPEIHDIVFLGEFDFSKTALQLGLFGYDFSISLAQDAKAIFINEFNDVNIYLPFSDLSMDMTYKDTFPGSFGTQPCFMGLATLIDPLSTIVYPSNLYKIHFSDNSNVKIDDGILYIDDLPYIPTGANRTGNLETEGIEIAEGIEICIFNSAYVSAGILDYCYKTKGNLIYSLLAPAYESLPKIPQLTLPSSLRAISDEAFRYHYFENEVFVIPDGVEYVGNHFLPFTAGDEIGIKYVYVPSSVAHLGRQYDDIIIYKESDGYSLDDFAAEVGVTIPEGFIGGTLPKTV